MNWICKLLGMQQKEIQQIEWTWVDFPFPSFLEFRTTVKKKNADLLHEFWAKEVLANQYQSWLWDAFWLISSFNLNDTKYTKGAKAPHEATNLHPVHSSRRINAGFASKQWASVHQSPQWVENSRSTLGNFRFRFYPLIFTDLDPKRLSLHRTSLQGTSRTFRHLRPRLPWASEIDLLKVHHSPVCERSLLYISLRQQNDLQAPSACDPCTLTIESQNFTGFQSSRESNVPRPISNSNGCVWK